MTVKDSVLEALKNNSGVYISGSELSEKLSVSRAAVWKGIQALRGEGYIIESATNRGYMMPPESGTLTEESVRLALSPRLRNNRIIVYDSTDSTNLRLRQLLLDGNVKSGTTVIANQQTAGRGRLGRSFFSPREGLYLSIALVPVFDINRSSLVTVAAAVAVAEAIDFVLGIESAKPAMAADNSDNIQGGQSACEDAAKPVENSENIGTNKTTELTRNDKIYDQDPGLSAANRAENSVAAGHDKSSQSAQIKWVNDIYLNDRKVCGILTEAVSDFESGNIESLIIGIGVNTSLKGFPEDLLKTAGAVEGNYSKSVLAAKIIEGTLKYTGEIGGTRDTDLAQEGTGGQTEYNCGQITGNDAGNEQGSQNVQSRSNETGIPSFIQKYRDRSLLTGRTIKVYKGVYRKDPREEIGGTTARVLGIDDEGGLEVIYTDGTRETLRTGEVSVRL